jgi:hypothetical protein
VQIQLSHPELVVDLVGFFHRAEMRALQVGPAVVEVDLPDALDGRQAELEINLMVRVWRLLHPAVTVVQLSAPG